MKGQGILLRQSDLLSETKRENSGRGKSCFIKRAVRCICVNKCERVCEHRFKDSLLTVIPRGAKVDFRVT